MESDAINPDWKHSESKNDDSILPVDLKKITSVSTDSFPDYSNLPDKVKVFLKIRPSSENPDLSNESKDEIFTILNPTNFLTKIPIVDVSSSKSRQSKHVNNADTPNLRKYKFTRILKPEISQTQLFDEIAKQNCIDFIDGQCSTLMSYGTSNSGKTYSLFGANDCLGIIPRCLKFLFSNLKITGSPIFKPDYGKCVSKFVEMDRISDNGIKEKCRKIEEKLQNVESFLNLSDCLVKEDDGYLYSIWISFFEIYNEGIFDLLRTNEEGKNVQLKLVVDKNGNNYLKGVGKVFAANGEEAFQIMTTGKSRLRVASTAMNCKSSRSHAIFTVTLLKYQENSSTEDVTVSTLTFCDLAGNGGLRMTKNSQRIKESRSINASLLVLGRCLKTIQENSMSKNNTEITGPFRESNLTRYLQKALSGKEKLTILINLNKSPELYLETQNVLNFVSTLNKMTLETKNKRKPTFSRSSTWINSPKLSSSNIPQKIVTTPNSEKLNNQKLKKENEILMAELKMLKNESLNKEYEIRQELTDLYSSKIKDLENDWRKKTEALDEEREDLLKWSVKQVEDYYKERISNITSGNRKRKRLNSHEGHGDHGDSKDSTIENLEYENEKATSKIIALREVVDDLKKKNLELSVQKSELMFELSVTKSELDKMKNKHKNESIEENSFKGHRESFIFEFTENLTRADQLQDELNEKKEEVEKLKLQLENKDREISKIRKNLQVYENTILENSILESSILESSILESSNLENSLKDESIEDKFNTSKSGLNSSKNGLNTSKDGNSTLQVSLGGSLNSMHRISIIEEENSLFDDEPISLRTLVTIPILETLTFPEDRLSFLDSSIEKSEKSLKTIPSDDDSGIRTSSGSRGTNEFNKIENDDKEIQVGSNFAEREKEEKEAEEKEIKNLKSKLETLRIEYETLGDNYSLKSQKLEDMAQEMEKFKASITKLESLSIVDHLKLEEYEILLASKNDDLNRLNLDKKELETKYNVTCKNWKMKIKDYEKKFEDCFNKEEMGISVPNDIEKSIEKCVNLGNQIKIDQAQLEEKVFKCSSEHIPKIRKLEKELAEKNQIVDNLHEEISEAKIDLSRVEQFNERMKKFETALHSNQKERDNLQKELQERITHQQTLEIQLTMLSEEITKRDSELLLLNENVNHAKTTNSINYKNTNELNNLVSESLLKMSDIKSELSRSEEARNNLDRNWVEEYGFLRSQLTIFENQGNFMALMHERHEDILTEAMKLKQDLDVKNKEIREIKRHRDDTIRRYDSLVDQLQMDVDVIKQNKEYLTSQESNKQLKKSISETFKFKKRKSKTNQLNPKENSKIWSSQTIGSSASLESIPKVVRRSCQCPRVRNGKKNREVESESILNIISSKLSGFYSNIESQSGTTLIRIVDNRNSNQERKFTEEKQLTL